MDDLGFKRLTSDNWLEPDAVLSIFVRLSLQDGSTRTLSSDEWAQKFLDVELSEAVPLEVRRLFAVARGALVYGYYFYPLYTLGTEQLFRLAETAVGRKSRDIGLSSTKLKKLNFKGRVTQLIESGVIHPSAQLRWDALWDLRNLTSHPEDQTILPPGVAVGELRRIAADIEGLFV